MKIVSVHALLLLVFFVFIADVSADENAPVSKGTTTVKPLSVSYWLWPTGKNFGLSEGSDIDTEQKFIPDSLYVKAGEVTAWEYKGEKNTEISLEWPIYLPVAKSYNAVIRIAENVNLTDDLSVKLADNYRQLKLEALKKGQKLDMLQIDYDSPTEKLHLYASFLKKLAYSLNNDSRLSITALLDWFRKDTDIKSVIENVYEFVPQFYDVNPHQKEIDLLNYDEGIAHPVDSGKWKKIFGSFGKTYKIGLASFGRVYDYKLENDARISSGKIKIDCISEDGSPEYTFRNPEKLRIAASLKSVTGERILRFDEKEGNDHCSYSGITEVIVPTKESILSQHSSVSDFDGGFSGIVFFRWPLQNEKLVLSPDEIESYINAASGRPEYGLKIEDGYCVAVKCSEIYFKLKDFFPEKSSTIVIRSSSPLEYFVPGTGLKSKISDEKIIQITVPPYSLKTWIYLGRAVNRKQATFSIQEQKR